MRVAGTDHKALIIAQWEATREGPKAIADRLGTSREYTAFVLRLHRGGDDHRAAHDLRDAHRAHVRACLAAGSFVWRERRPA